MKPTSHAARFAVAVAALSLVGVASAGAPDRLDRFRALAATQLAAGALGDDSAETYREVYALLDDEIVESLASGGVFASLGFLQDRLDTFGEVWGATVVRLVRVGDVLVGAFQLAGTPVGNSVRVYGRLDGEAALLVTFTRAGRPSVLALRQGGAKAARFLMTWEGPPTGRGTRPLRMELAHPQGDGVRVTWSTAQLFPDGLLARGWSVRGSEIRVRYEVQYPGWTPGCDGQTEQEDVYRVGSGGASVTRVARRLINPWHREFRGAVARLFDAVAAGNGNALAGLVPDAAMRRLLPPSLAPEPACDARETIGPERVSVAARDAERPWQLTFQRGPAGWRLVSAMPVLQ
ncbi:MAG: hypothetical protein HYU51_04410 [Candidatus Rokubacteria bacterium]|nr:hypothetical protein [Candidatus Rokubacteria bacterium]